MEGQQAAVITVLRDPYHVWRSSRYRNRRLYYCPFVLPRPHEREYLLVVADYPPGRESGRIITAYARPNIIRGDTLLWLRPNAMP